ncbi:uncharacterized protein LOC106519103 [Austrofundulus limnaeus]|uniref:Uncharacterized protein LOC106519103 n=1 Tax=Austrofundulus limnaeus TaxID=52670 RepID=A0A2I4BEC0_AUSLI|nr:PREDICTED: uncharacterized protein LOC106519103 [Austrofundulus limnaeus]
MSHLLQVLSSVGHYIPACRQVTSGLCSANIFNKMRNLLLGVFLGLFVVVHPTPVNTVTQIPVTFEDDIYHDVKAEEFIVDPFTPRSVSNAHGTPTTTELVLDGKVESHQTPVVFQESQQLPSDATTESSGKSQPTPLSVSDSPTTQSVMDVSSAFLVSDQLLTDFTTEGSADPTSSTRLFEGSGFSPAASRSVITSTVLSDTTVQTPQQTFTDFFTEESTTGFEEGSGHSPTRMGLVVDSVDASTTTEPPETFATIKDAVVPRNRSRLFLQRLPSEDNAGTEKHLGIKELINGPNSKDAGMHKGHSTPDWIIIVAFIAALAALIAVCAAIATRDKWNHPNQVSESTTNCSNQKRELEMQPFVHKVEPKENKNNGDYTVIPLDDAPDNFSSD